MTRQSLLIQNIDKRKSAKAMDELFLSVKAYRKSSACSAVFFESSAIIDGKGLPSLFELNKQFLLII